MGGIGFLDDVVKQLVGKTFATESLKWSQYFISSYCIGLLIALNFTAARKLSAGMSSTRVPEEIITYFAGFTFSLYLFHYPLLQFFSAVCDFLAVGNLKPIIVIGGSLFAVWLLGSWAERQKHPIRKFLLKLLPESKPPVSRE